MKIYNKNLSLLENRLIEASIPYLRSFIKDMGGFYPFAMVMDANEIITPMSPNIDEDYPNSQDLIYLYKGDIKRKISDINSSYQLGIICIDIYLHSENDDKKQTENAIEFKILSIEEIKTMHLVYEKDLQNDIKLTYWS